MKKIFLLISLIINTIMFPLVCFSQTSYLIKSLDKLNFNSTINILSFTFIIISLVLSLFLLILTIMSYKTYKNDKKFIYKKGTLIALIVISLLNFIIVLSSVAINYINKFNITLLQIINISVSFMMLLSAIFVIIDFSKFNKIINAKFEKSVINDIKSLTTLSLKLSQLESLNKSNKMSLSNYTVYRTGIINDCFEDDDLKLHNNNSNNYNLSYEPIKNEKKMHTKFCEEQINKLQQFKLLNKITAEEFDFLKIKVLKKYN